MRERGVCVRKCLDDEVFQRSTKMMSRNVLEIKDPATMETQMGQTCEVPEKQFRLILTRTS